MGIYFDLKGLFLGRNEMTILNWQVGTMGQVSGGIPQQQPPFPTFIYITTNDTNATVTTAGYLNTLKNEGFYVSKYNMAVVYTTDDGCQIYQITVGATGLITLVADVNPGNVLLPVVAGHIASFTNIMGQIGDTLTPITHLGNIVAGASTPVAGTFTSFPAASGGANDKLVFAAVTTGGNFTTTFSNGTMAQTSVFTLADPGNAVARVLTAGTATPFVNNHSLVATGTGGAVADAGYQLKTVAQAAVAGGAAAQTVVDAFCTAASNVIAVWNDTTNPVTIQKVAAGIGQFVVTSSVDPGASHINYIITKV